MDVNSITTITNNNQGIQSFLQYYPTMNLDYTCVTNRVPSTAEYAHSVSHNDDGTYQFDWHLKEFTWRQRDDTNVNHVHVTFKSLTRPQIHILWAWLSGNLSNNNVLGALKWCWTHQSQLLETPYTHRLMITKILHDHDSKGYFKEWLQVSPAHLLLNEDNPYLAYFIQNANAKELITIYSALRSGQYQGKKFYIGETKTSKVEQVFDWLIQKMNNRISFLVTVSELKETLTQILRSDQIYYVGPSWVSESKATYPGVTFLSTKKTVEELMKTLPKYPLTWWDSLGEAFYKEYADNISLKNKAHIDLFKHLNETEQSWLLQKYATESFKNGNQLAKLHTFLKYTSLNDLDVIGELLKNRNPDLPVDAYINAYKEHILFNFDVPKPLHQLSNALKVVDVVPEEEVLLFL